MATKSSELRQEEIRAVVLSLLAEQPHSGTEIANVIIERGSGHWQVPSASIYPVLGALDNEGIAQLVPSADANSGQRRFELTAAGQQFVQDNASQLVAPWDRGADSWGQAGAPAAAQAAPEAGGTNGDAGAAARPAQQGSREDEAARFQQAAAQFDTAVEQVVQVASPEQLDRAAKLVVQCKRGLYRILADDDAGD